jgi:hypothetical protein
MEALMSRPQLMTLMMQLMAKVGEVDPGKMQEAMQSGDQSKIAESFGMAFEEFQLLQSQLQSEFTLLAQENPEIADHAETMMKQFGQVPPSQ